MTQEELARYFLVVRITGALFDFAISLISGIVALLAVLVGISLTRMQNAHLAVIRFVLVISAPIFIAVAAFGEPLATLFMGPQYLGSGILLSILTLAIFFDLIIILLLIGRQAGGQTRVIPLVWAGLLAMKIILVFFLSAYGLFGISIAVLTSELLTSLIVYTYLRKEISLGMFWIKLFFPMLLVLAIGIVVNILALDVVLAVIISVLSVLLSVFVGLRIRVLTAEDIVVIRSVGSPKLKWIIDMITRIGGYPLKDSNTKNEI